MPAYLARLSALYTPEELTMCCQVGVEPSLSSLPASSAVCAAATQVLGSATARTGTSLWGRTLAGCAHTPSARGDRLGCVCSSLGTNRQPEHCHA